MNKYEKFAIYFDWKRDTKTFKEYKEMLEHMPLEYLKYRCLKEMYVRAQPSVNLDTLLKEHFDRVSKGLGAEAFYDRYYLSSQEYTYILNKYVKEWNLKDPWYDYFDLIIHDIENAHPKYKWIPEHTDELGTHPGYRSYEEAPPLKDTIGEDATEKVIEFLKDRQNFYYHNQKENSFRVNISLGISPNSNAESVKKYWNERGIYFTIDLREHSDDYFWCEEEGYSKKELKELEERERKEKEKWMKVFIYNPTKQ